MNEKPFKTTSSLFEFIYNYYLKKYRIIEIVIELYQSEKGYVYLPQNHYFSFNTNDFTLWGFYNKRVTKEMAKKYLKNCELYLKVYLKESKKSQEDKKNLKATIDTVRRDRVIYKQIIDGTCSDPVMRLSRRQKNTPNLTSIGFSLLDNTADLWTSLRVANYFYTRHPNYTEKPL